MATNECHNSCMSGQKDALGNPYFCNICKEDSSLFIDSITWNDGWSGIYAKDQYMIPGCYDITAFVEKFIEYRKEFPFARIYVHKFGNNNEYRSSTST